MVHEAGDVAPTQDFHALGTLSIASLEGDRTVESRMIEPELVVRASIVRVHTRR